MSAIKVAREYHSLALLGTNFSDAKVDEVLAEGYKYVYLCLDNDATWEAIRLVLHCQKKLKNLRVKGLEKDIKEMNETEFAAFINFFKEELAAEETK